ncbi:hypothetical protein Acsp06_34870 [Actinomycetospora sp. NBRC 106375]|uniref:hypothetical protein n=1 Tax=Actinomycetospora sp. NBRC 106375 TaxID=3032207 RepID=UPI0024A40AD9|nr:hypothetical protein [Actinomycetospora sp. NBRC 106375]GLZ47302.1 hypothetical protein Acsp06_34870 [Actinomycetospora sp. NBRC 106375]
MSGIDPADLARLRSRPGWSGERAECRHREVVMAEDELPRCESCGEILSPDALRRAGHKPVRP